MLLPSSAGVGGAKSFVVVIIGAYGLVSEVLTLSSFPSQVVTNALTQVPEGIFEVSQTYEVEVSFLFLSTITSYEPNEEGDVEDVAGSLAPSQTSYRIT